MISRCSHRCLYINLIGALYGVAAPARFLWHFSVLWLLLAERYGKLRPGYDDFHAVRVWYSSQNPVTLNDVLPFINIHQDLATGACEVNNWIFPTQTPWTTTSAAPIADLNRKWTPRDMVITSSTRIRIIFGDGSAWRLHHRRISCSLCLVELQQ